MTSSVLMGFELGLGTGLLVRDALLVDSGEGHPRRAWLRQRGTEDARGNSPHNPRRTSRGLRVQVRKRSRRGREKAFSWCADPLFYLCCSIRTPGTPPRWQDFDRELTYVWGLLEEAVATQPRNLDRISDLILTLCFYWYNFMPLSRGKHIRKKQLFPPRDFLFFVR